MQFSFLGFSSMKIMEFNLDVKDMIILKYFNDFKNSGKMNFEVVNGEKYYWLSYQNIENELPFLGLAKRAIMARMFKMKKLGILKHYTKKDGGTFSYYALGERFNELLYSYPDKDTYNDKSNKEGKNNNSNIAKGIPFNEEGMNKKEDTTDKKEVYSDNYVEENKECAF